MTVRRKGRQYQADFMVDGKRHRKSFDKETEAEAWELQTRAALKLGQPLPATKATVAGGGKTLGALMRTVEQTHWSCRPGSHNTVANGHAFVRFVGEKVPIEDALTTDKALEFVDYLIEERNVGDSTVNRYLSAISTLARYGGQKPVLPWRKPGENRIRWFSDEEEAMILQTLTLWGMRREYDLFLFLADTGARPWAEALRFGRRDLGKRTVTFWETKNGKARTVPLTARAWDAVQRQLRLHNEDNPFAGLDQWHMIDVWRRLRSHIPQLNDAVIYTWRHTCCSRLVQRGVDLIRVKEWMGHKSLATTMRYAHLAPRHLIEAAAVLEPGYQPQFRVIEGDR